MAPQPLVADPADIAAASRSVVRVVLISRTGDGVQLIGHGSGIAVAPDLVLTNAHVVAKLAEDPSLRAGIVPAQGRSGYFAKVVAFNARNDLALLRLTDQAQALGADVPPALALPLYLRDKVAQTTAERALAKANATATGGQAGP